MRIAVDEMGLTMASSSGVHFLDIVVVYMVVGGGDQSRALSKDAKSKRTLARY